MKRFLLGSIYKVPAIQVQKDAKRATRFSDVDTIILMLLCILMWLLSS